MSAFLACRIMLRSLDRATVGKSVRKRHLLQALQLVFLNFQAPMSAKLAHRILLVSFDCAKVDKSVRNRQLLQVYFLLSLDCTNRQVQRNKLNRKSSCNKVFYCHEAVQPCREVDEQPLKDPQTGVYRQAGAQLGMHSWTSLAYL